MWDLYLTDEVDRWLDGLAVSDRVSYELVVAAIEVLAESGPSLGRPLVDRLKGSSMRTLKELRPGASGRSEVRILFAFDPWRSAVLLVAGDKAGAWSSWYREAIPRAERLFREYVASRREEEGD
ncbi:MAG: type II toxin-antitoxin system RelE/ParE family toxin [Candidatus Nanopelagicales bacterium]|nr:type II toxin-antitoxin system RelE/ParE family toxin [Candidatus Nanopelagicales bacterium]